MSEKSPSEETNHDQAVSQEDDAAIIKENAAAEDEECPIASYLDSQEKDMSTSSLLVHTRAAISAMKSIFFFNCLIFCIYSWS